MAVDSNTPQRVYSAGPAGLVRSADGGLTWEGAGEGLTGEPLAVTLDATAPQNIYTALVDGSVWHSEDGATTWQKLGVGQ
ncbi:hypothetical protein KC957_04050 [Candidatus Saccharibacteria bacterium]|nr:hypothetical protein [Candidatus Saccharibacteria bacterium]